MENICNNNVKECKIPFNITKISIVFFNIYKFTLKIGKNNELLKK